MPETLATKNNKFFAMASKHNLWTLTDNKNVVENECQVFLSEKRWENGQEIKSGSDCAKTHRIP